MSDRYDTLSKEILSCVGGRENVTAFLHCFTRLRFTVKDRSLVDEEGVKGLEGVLGTQWVKDQFQVIIGQEVKAVYERICQLGGFPPLEEVSVSQGQDKKRFSPKNIFNDMIAAASACVEPIFAVFIIGGLFKLFAVLLGPDVSALLPADHDLVVLLGMVGETCFTFIPVFVAYSSAKLFHASIPLALILACLLLHPSLVAMVNAGQAFTVYGIPMYPASYANSFLPTLLITWALSKVEHFFRRIFPEATQLIFVPIFTMLVMLPLALCVLGPLGTIIGEGIASFIVWINDIAGPLATGLVGALFPLLIVTGMHHALNSAALIEYTKKGFDTCIFTASYILDFQLLSLCVATLLKSKQKESKAIAVNCIITEGIGGISEPTLFGIILKSKRNIAYIILGGFVAGFYIGLMQVKCYVLAPGGFLSVLAYSGGSVENFIHGVIACVIAFVIPFTLAMIFGLEDKN